ncbi:MAG: LamG domain-containing protein [Bacteroidota bacterium]|nr:LamG domain-containing protein [Bacteroidota bacterium]
MGDYNRLSQLYTINGNPTIKPGYDGSPCMDFDGTGDYVQTTVNAEANFGTGDFTVMAWVKVGDLTGNNGLIEKATWGGAEMQGWLLRLDSSEKLRLYQGDGTNGEYDSNSTAISQDTWTHVCAVRSTNKTEFYYDGALIHTVNNTTRNVDLNRVMSIGQGYDDGNRLDGEIQNPMLFNRALTADEISNIYHGKAFDYNKDIVSEWDMSTINPPDIGWRGEGNDGTGTGIASSNLTDGHDGGKAISFNGTDEKVDFGDLGNIRTVSLWVNPDTTTEELFLVDTGKDVMLSGGTVTYTGLTETNTFIDGVDTNTMVADKYQHLVCVFTEVDANNFELANDGSNYGDIDVDSVAVYSGSLENIEAEDIHVQTK